MLACDDAGTFPAYLPGMNSRDDLNAAKGILNGLAISALLWALGAWAYFG